MAYILDEEYYTNNGVAPTDANWGSYQYVSLLDIVNNFELMYTGNDSLLNNVPRYKILFHAKRVIQQLNYDALKNVKYLELNIGLANQFVFPSDCVDWIRVSYNNNGTLFPLVENVQSNFANSYLQGVNNEIIFDVNGNVIDVQSQLDIDRLAGKTQQQYMGGGIYNGSYGWCINGDWFFTRSIGVRFGLNPETANINGTYKVDEANGVINFSSDMSGLNMVLEYITDGMENGNDSKILVNKLAEEAIYLKVKALILGNKTGVTLYDRTLANKQAKAEMDNAKIRMAGIRPETLLMSLRGQHKIIK